MAGHTPGPWRVVIDDDGNPLSGRPGVFAADEYDCGIVHWDGFVQDYWRSARGDKEIHANARLIASAPELLEALEKAAQWFEDYATEHYRKALTAPDSGEQHGREVKGKLNRERANELRTAIARATGAAS